MERRRLEDLKRFSPEKMQKIAVFQTPRLFLDLYCLAPGQAQRRHAHAGSDKVYHVLQGEATVVVAGEEARLGAGETALAPAGSEHAIENRTGSDLAVLVVLVPPPEHG